MTTLEETKQASGLRWWQGVDRYCWLILVIAALGWLFDCLDQNLLTLVRQPSVKELLEHAGMRGAELDAATRAVGGQITSVFLLGWATGGFIFGVLGDRLGRTRTMMITITIYALFTGLNGLVQTPLQYAVCRFLTALGVGGEFAAGASLVAEVWPERSRPMALGTLQALSAIGNMTAALVSAGVTAAGLSWRSVYFVGAAPALLVVWIRSAVKEPERWQLARVAAASDPSQELGKMGQLFTDRRWRRSTLAGVLLGAAGVGGLWGVGFFLPDLTGSVLQPLAAHLPEQAAKAQVQQWRNQVFFIQQVGAFFGMFSYAALSQRTGRRPALLLFFLLAWGSVVATFWGLRDLTSACLFAFVMGYCALAPFAAYAVYFPELFPTRLRSTGVGFCYNCARILAAAAPFALGQLAAHFTHPDDKSYGFRMAATIVSSVYLLGLVGLALAPETRGEPLPD
jgi:MFS family permease